MSVCMRVYEYMYMCVYAQATHQYVSWRVSDFCLEPSKYEPTTKIESILLSLSSSHLPPTFLPTPPLSRCQLEAPLFITLSQCIVAVLGFAVLGILGQTLPNIITFPAFEYQPSIALKVSCRLLVRA